MKTPLPLRRGVFPLCFSSAAQYRIWKASAQRVKPGDSKYCADCTSEYQSDMILQRRCAYPGTTFHTAADGFLDGVRPGCRLPNRRKEGV
jgi:hypothetical protein